MADMDDKITQSVLDRPNSYIGKSVPRPNAKRLVQGRGHFVDDINLPRMLHVAYVRSPYAHAKITDIDFDEAKDMPGVVRIFTGEEIAEVMEPFVAVLGHFEGMKSPPQYPLAIDKVFWQGEPVVAVVAQSRAQAEDAAEVIMVDYEELEPLVDAEQALKKDAPIIHEGFKDNKLFSIDVGTDGVDDALKKADEVIEAEFVFNRQTAVTLEPRGIVSSWDPSEERLTVYQPTQTPNQAQDVISRHFNIPENNVRVITQDVGGSFGLKIHVSGDEYATIAISKIMHRPIKFIADRMESFQSDIHARSHTIKVKAGFTKDGDILCWDLNDLAGVGAYSTYPRTSAVEGFQVVRITGGPYKHPEFRSHLDVVFQNKVHMSQYRAVGHPIACAVAENVMDMAARKLGMDPADIRERNYVTDDMYPYKAPSGIIFEKLSHHASLNAVKKAANYDKLRKDVDAAQKKGVYQGLGIASYVELTTPGPMLYGMGGARITSKDGVTIKMEPTGKVKVACSVTDSGQGTETIVAQVVATELGVPIDDVQVMQGDTEITPFGGGTWGSRGAGVASTVAAKAARDLRNNVLDVAGVMLQSEPDKLDARDGKIVDKDTGNERIEISEVGRVAYFRPDTLPQEFHPQLTVARHWVTQGLPFAFTNGCHISHVEVDVETGFVKLLNHWVAEDCGTVLNPMLVDEQVRGGVVHGLGGFLFEEIIYDDEGQLLNGSMMDYLVPLSSEMPDIHVSHVETPTEYWETGVKGAGESGTAGSGAAAMNAINDALKSFDVRLNETPLTPKRIFEALGKI